MGLRLPGVTLVSVTSVDVERTHSAVVRCANLADFGAVKLLCSSPPKAPDPRVQVVPIPPLDFRGYSRFVFEKLDGHVDTEHCLVVQADGFILDPARWSDEFLGYDYIGAPWPEFLTSNVRGSEVVRLDRNRVGNGGFSLRSKKLLRTTAGIPFDTLRYPIMSEDLLICHYLYDVIGAMGIRFAPPELAARFSIESTLGLYGQALGTVFGFHGKHWLNLGLGREGGAVHKARRNEPCPCGSGRKFKHCHGVAA